MANGTPKTNVNGGVTKYVLQWASLIVVGIGIPFMAYIAKTSISNQISIARIEANRFTDKEARLLLQELIKRDDSLEVRLDAINDEVSHLPPDEWRRRIRALENHLSKTDGYQPPE